MNKILEWFNVKKLFLFSSVFTVLFFVLFNNTVLLNICDTQKISCLYSMNYVLMFLLIFVTILIPNFILLFLNKKIFISWSKTLFFYLMIYFVVILITPWKAGDVYLRIEKDMFALYLSVIYFVFSIVTIVYYSLKK